MAEQSGTGDGSAVLQRPARRLNQDYTNMYWYLSDPVWQILKSQESQRTKAEHLLEYLYLNLQLRLPSEPTLGMATALVLCNQRDVRNFDLRNALEATRSTWKALYKRMQRSNPDNGMDLVQSLSRSAQELPTALQARVAAAVPPEVWPITETDLGILARRVPLRKASTEKEQDASTILVQHFTQALAMYLPQSMHRQREPQASLKNLKIFSPRSHLGDGKCNGNVEASGRPQAALRDQMHLEQGRPGHSTDPPADASLREELSLVPVGPERMPAGQSVPALSQGAVATVSSANGTCLRDNVAEAEAAGKESRLLHTPARRACEAEEGGGTLLRTPPRRACEAEQGGRTLLRTPARRACEAEQAARSSPFPLAQEFVESRDKHRDKHATSPRGVKRPAASANAAKSAAAKKATKKACALKRPAASGKESRAPGGASREDRKKAVEYRNETFQAKGYGSCKVEYYTAKSYIRQWSTEDERWRMIIGATGSAHREICHSLLQHVRMGMSREKLLTVRATIMERLQ